MKWLAQAPSNIALIKYMGKTDAEQNLPTNASLSYTLNNLQTTVELEDTRLPKDMWEPLEMPGSMSSFELSDAAQQRFIDHLQVLKNYFHFKGHFVIHSSNNFPHSAGIASSASSFAALTKCAVRAMCELTYTDEPSAEIAAMLSRQGSGSSCRSFFSPWALWDKDGVRDFDLPYPDLIHQVVIANRDIKAVSSSEAHLRVASSPLFAGRTKRAELNLKTLVAALKNKQWNDSFEIVWTEFQDMHQLFETCEQPFSYMTDDSRSILDTLQELWHTHGDGPLVTMDAGPNVHLLYRPDQAELAKHMKQDHFVGNYDVL